MLNWTERIIRMRKEVPEIGWGDFKVIATRDPAILVIRYDWRNNSVLFVHNLDEKPREISFAVGLPGEAGKLLVNLLTEDHSRADETGRHNLLMEGYGYRWYRVGGLDYLLKRSRHRYGYDSEACTAGRGRSFARAARLRQREAFTKLTGVPFATRSATRSASQFVRRTQPWDSALETLPGAGVP